MNRPFPLLSSTELARRRARLLARINRRFSTISEELSIGPLRIPFTRVKDPNVVLDQIIAAEDRRERETSERRDGNDLHLPYWAELWDSSYGVGSFLSKHLSLFVAGSSQRNGLSTQHSALSTKLSALDLGCGMGLAGAVAVALGMTVLLADLEQAALLFAKLNTLQFSDRVRVRQMNWQIDCLNEQFDLIIGADVLYERAQWDFLEPFWRAHLKPNGKVLLGEPGRQTGDLFVDWIVTKSWRLERFEEKAPGREKPIRLLVLTM